MSFRVSANVFSNNIRGGSSQNLVIVNPAEPRPEIFYISTMVDRRSEMKNM